MEKITIENYEAFYLDFLEGNLGETEQAMLELFLSDHPELKVDFDEFSIVPSKNEAQLSNFEKSLLKQTDFNFLDINQSTIEILLIAKNENLLNPNKIKELEAFLNSNLSYQRTDREIRATKLKADINVIYEDKKQLKKDRKIIPMWSLVASIAAIFIVFFTFNFNSNNPSNQLSKSGLIIPIIENNTTKKESNQLFSDPKKDSKVVLAENISNKLNYKDNQAIISSPTEAITIKNENISLKLKEIKVPNSIDVNDLEIVKNNFPSTIQRSKLIKVNDAMLGMNEMENPIQPITKQLSHLTNKEVDFKISKPKIKGKKSFYLKIGKLEISRKSH